MSKVHDSAHVLENEIRDSKEFNDLKASFEAVMNDAETKKMFEDFRDTQMELQEKQIQGLEISEEEIEEARKVVEIVQQNEDIAGLMEAEQTLNEIINDISRIITMPLEELYGNPNA